MMTMMYGEKPSVPRYSRRTFASSAGCCPEVTDSPSTRTFRNVGGRRDGGSVVGGCTSTCTLPVRPAPVAVMVAVPSATPVTTPSAFTVATDGSEVVHATASPATPPEGVRTVATTRWCRPPPSAGATGRMPIHPASRAPAPPRTR